MFNSLARALAILLGAVCTAVAAEQLQEFRDAELVPAEYNDGDSFRVSLKRDGKAETHLVRLYFVDAFELVAQSKTDMRRLLEQTRYFGFADENRLQGFEFGKRAKARVTELLSKPFILHTAFSSALGRSREPRIYGMIATAGEEDLAAELVREGLARVHGTPRKRPDGTPAKHYEQFLGDLQLQAAVKKRGAWAVSDFDRITELREQQRRADRELEMPGGSSEEEPGEPVDLNTATVEELETLKHIGPALAKRIIDQRPYKSVNDLTRVKGISSSLLEKLRPHVSVDNVATDRPSQGKAKQD